ncbi:MAG: dipeptide epimerase [Flavobacteriaceae bacterium]|nr:dipeptide epimerase [Flavobacteriaceae bacterium]
MKVILRTFTLQLKEQFTIARDSYHEQETLIVELIDGQYSGLGEATSKSYYGVTTQKMITAIERVSDELESIRNIAPTDFWRQMHPYFKEHMFALCALDMAYHDLYAKKQGKKLHEVWQLSTKKVPLSNYTIGIDDINVMVEKLKQQPWPIYKIKLGTPDDLKIINELRKHTNAIFRVDANCGWTVAETIYNSKVLKNLGVEFIEQPLKADDWQEHKEVFHKSELPIIADESCQVETDVEKCHDHFHGINVKLVKCGGLTPAKRMLEKAKALKMKTMAGCMTESSIGISAIAHLLPLLDYVDMDGALLLKQDIAEGVKIRQGKIYFSELNGIGASLIDP